MDGVVHIRKVVDVVLNTGQGLGILQEAFHLRFGTAIAQLQVIQHGVVLFGETLVSIGDPLHVGAELIGVIGHICQRHVGNFRRLGGIPAQALQQGCRKAGDLLHIAIGGHSSSLVCLLRIGNHRGGRILEQCFDATQTLLQIGSGHDGTA